MKPEDLRRKSMKNQTSKKDLQEINSFFASSDHGNWLSIQSAKVRWEKEHAPKRLGNVTVRLEFSTVFKSQSKTFRPLNLFDALWNSKQNISFQRSHRIDVHDFKVRHQL